jgi:putative transposase
VFGPWQTIWTWHRRMAGDGTWDTVLERLLTIADAAGESDWAVSVDSTIAWAHQHATNIRRLIRGLRAEAGEDLPLFAAASFA